MSNETWEIVTSNKIEEIELQLALQCAPLIARLKISNLLNIRNSDFATVKRIIAGSDISWYVLLQSEDKLTILLYHEESLKNYLESQEVKNAFFKFGYRHIQLDCILKEFCVRYERHMLNKGEFPHEMGLLLGYPVEDVIGFVDNKGKDSLYTGYWKVYGNKDKKLRLFDSFESAKERLIKLLSCGVSMIDIIHTGCMQTERYV
jgi:hypothetical protein